MRIKFNKYFYFQSPFDTTEETIYQEIDENTENNLFSSHDKNKFESFFVPSSNKTVVKPKNFICPASILKMKINEEKEYSFNQKQILILQTTENHQHALFENIRSILLTAKIKFILRDKIDIENDFQTPALILFECYKDYLNYKDLAKFNEFIKKNKIGLMIFNNDKNGKKEVKFTKCQLNEDKFLEKVL